MLKEKSSYVKTIFNVVIVFVFVFLFLLMLSIFENKDRRKRESLRIANYEYCLEEAYEDYMYNWGGACFEQGLEDDCQLPMWRKEGLDEMYNNDMDRCAVVHGIPAK